MEGVELEGGRGLLLYSFILGDTLLHSYLGQIYSSEGIN